MHRPHTHWHSPENQQKRWKGHSPRSQPHLLPLSLMGLPAQRPLQHTRGQSGGPPRVPPIPRGVPFHHRPSSPAGRSCLPRPRAVADQNRPGAAAGPPGSPQSRDPPPAPSCTTCSFRARWATRPRTAAPGRWFSITSQADEAHWTLLINSSKTLAPFNERRQLATMATLNMNKSRNVFRLYDHHVV